MRTRRLVLWIHRWAGVIAGLLILVVAVTGALLVFPGALIRWRHPDLFPQFSDSARAPVEDALDHARREYPGARVQGLRLPRDDADALVLFTGNRAIHFDPHTGRMLGARPRADGLTQTLVRLHVNLLMGRSGAVVVIVTTIITIGLALTGLWLWWPLRIAWLRKGGSFRRFNLDLHSVAGLYSSLFLLIIGVTGITLRYWHGEHPKPPRMQAPADSSQTVSVDHAIRAAQSALPESRAAAVEMPPPDLRAPYRIQLAFPEDGSPAGRSVVFVDPFTGAVLETHSSRSGTLAERYQNHQLSLHTGAIGGIGTKLIAMLVCFALVLQIGSGFVLWLKK